MTTNDLDTVCYCPFHEGPIVSACTLSSCDLWVEPHPLHCGYVAYRKHQATERPEELNWKTIGDILGYSSKEVEALSKEAYEILRQVVVQDQVPAEWSLLRNSKHCIVCNRQASIFESGWGWCSDKCYRWLPLSAVEAEARWGTWFRKLLRQWRQLTVKTIERLTGLNREAVRWLLWQHLGWDSTEEDQDLLAPCPEPWVHNPRIPSVDELLKRIETSELWGSHK